MSTSYLNWCGWLMGNVRVYNGIQYCSISSLARRQLGGRVAVLDCRRMLCDDAWGAVALATIKMVDDGYYVDANALLEVDVRVVAELPTEDGQLLGHPWM